jgi:hypothetical protein
MIKTNAWTLIFCDVVGINPSDDELVMHDEQYFLLARGVSVIMVTASSLVHTTTT